MQTLRVLPRIAAIVAFVIAGISVLGSLLGPIIALPIAIIPLCAGIGILRQRVWSAYGFATYSFAQLLLLPLILFRHGYSAEGAPQLIISILLSVVAGILFLCAGRSLAYSGAARGSAIPWIVVAALSVVPFLFIQTFAIPSESMEGTLLPGDRILAKIFPVHPPNRGEIVLFLSPMDRGHVIVKRVIAIPGDRIRISRKVVILNGNALDEKYVLHQAGEEDVYGEDFPNDSSIPDCAEGHEILSHHVVNGEIVVPPDGYFVLGDRRENSLDSRCYGFVGVADLIGKPLMIYDSVDQTPEQSMQPGLHWPGQTRWERLFKVF